MQLKSRRKVTSEQIVISGLKLMIETRIIINSNGEFLNGQASKNIKEIYVLSTKRLIKIKLTI